MAGTTRLCFILAAIWAICASPACAQQQWDVAKDFSTANNPNDQWTYGMTMSVSAPYSLTTYDSVEQSLYGSLGALYVWFPLSGTVREYPGVWYNPTDSAVASGATWAAHTVALHPGPEHEKSVARWTAAENGKYAIGAVFMPFGGPTTSTDVYVVQNGDTTGTILFGSNVLGAPEAYAAIVTLSAGDTVDFIAGDGPNNFYGLDLTGLDAKIALVGDDYGIVTGKVASSPGASSLEGAAVSASNGASAVTNWSGYYWMVQPSGTQNLQVSKTSYLAQSKDVVVTAGAATVQDFSLRKDAAKTCWNIKSDFSLDGNPNGDWTYGMAANLNAGYAFNVYPTAETDSTGLLIWHRSSPYQPGVFYNPTDSWIYDVYAPQSVSMHPTDGDEKSIVRWTAPTTGKYAVAVAFKLAKEVGNTDAHIVKNGSSSSDAEFLFEVGLNSTDGMTSSYSAIVSLSAGDTIDLALGSGSPAEMANDATAVDATISRVPDTAYWDPDADFSSEANPNGTWSYGMAPAMSEGVAPGYEFTRFTYPEATSSGLEIWHRAEVYQPAIFRNSTASTIDGWCPCHSFSLHPGYSGEKSCLRWTAPDAGEYQVDATFFLGTGGTDVHVVRNGSSSSGEVLYSNEVAGAAKCYSGKLSLNANDALDFLVGWGSDGSLANDLTRLALRISPAAQKTSWDAYEDFMLAGNPAGAWSYGYTYGLSVPYTMELYDWPNIESSGLQIWQRANAAYQPAIFCNNTDASIDSVYPSNSLTFHPGLTGEKNVVRWTAPADGDYVLRCNLTSLLITSAPGEIWQDAHVILNGASDGGQVLYENLHLNNSILFGRILTLVAGDTIDIGLGVGDDGVPGYDLVRLDANVSTEPPAEVSDLSGLGRLASGTYVKVTGAKVVTAATNTFEDGTLYVEEPDRHAGIKLIPGGELAEVTLGAKITFTGFVTTDANGERAIYALSIDSVDTTGDQLGVLGVTGKAAVRPIVIGLLCRTWGTISYVDADLNYIYVDDGSGSIDGTGQTGIRVVISGLVNPVREFAGGEQVILDGIVGLQDSIPVIRPRGDSDIVSME